MPKQLLLIVAGFLWIIPKSEIKKIQPKGSVIVSGVIRVGLNETDFKNGLGTLESDGTIRYWKYINLEQLSDQLPYEIEPIYIEKESDRGLEYPITAFKEIEITQGPHLGYAIQWFFFAALLAGGYPAFIRKNIEGNEAGKGEKEIKNDKY